jgi:hypothetical protein
MADAYIFRLISKTRKLKKKRKSVCLFFRRAMKCTHAACYCGIRDPRFRGTHWLCKTHRAALGESLLGNFNALTEYALLRSLVFHFPELCGPQEARARIFYVSETLTAPDKARAVLRAHGMLGVLVAPSVTQIDVIALVTDLVAFVVRHASILTQTDRRREELVSLCVRKSSEWYHSLVLPAGIRELMRAERLVYLIRREAGTVICLVRADFAVAFARMPRDVADSIYVAYVTAISKSEERRRAGHLARCLARGVSDFF